MPSFGGEAAVAETTTWLTPPHLLKALGQFDLDPCSPIKRPWDTARHHYTVEDDGLMQPWFGRVWLNPPYAHEAWPFMERMAAHGEGVALLFARTETRGFQDLVFPYASAMLFLRGRLKFHRLDGSLASTSQAPSVLIAYGDGDVQALRDSALAGRFVTL